MTYEEFIHKWANRTLYTSDHDVHGRTAGKVEMFRNNSYKLDRYRNPVVVDEWLTPTWHGWRDEKQRREFYKEAKLVGVRSNPKRKNEWYKIINII
jgi:hypothetical protein